MSKPYPAPNSPGDDPSSYTLEGAKSLSRNCQLCNGAGIATIFNPNYTGSAIGYEFDGADNRKPIVMRSTAYCLCPAGRKIMILRESSKAPPMADIHDVIAGRYHNWIADDPTYDPNQPVEIGSLRPEVERLARAIQIPRIYDEPNPPDEHDEAV